jgi:histidine ammonia-lyase
MVGARPLTVDDVVAVADGGPIALAPDAIERINAARRVVDGLVHGETLIYGLNTGLGHARNERVSVDVLREYQNAIVSAHRGGIGAPLPARFVRAAMLARVAGFAVGGSGISLPVAETLVAMLNRGVHPIVPRVGSVGASDLSHMAAIGVVAAGLGGRAEYEGEVLDGPDAMARAGIAPAQLQPKDGLALISANGMSVGVAALVAARAEQAAAAADLAVAASMEAVAGNPSIVDPAVARAKGVDGQRESADEIRELLAGSDRCSEGGARSVQDPLSFRVAPQVHGAYREAVRALAEAVEVELSASDDNPLVVAEEGRLVSNGNFHPMVLALAADALRPAIAHVAQLSSRRMSHLWSRTFEDPALLQPEGMAAIGEIGGGLLMYAAASRYAELRALPDRSRSTSRRWTWASRTTPRTRPAPCSPRTRPWTCSTTSSPWNS